MPMDFKSVIINVPDVSVAVCLSLDKGKCVCY